MNPALQALRDYLTSNTNIPTRLNQPTHNPQHLHPSRTTDHISSDKAGITITIQEDEICIWYWYGHSQEETRTWADSKQHHTNIPLADPQAFPKTLKILQHEAKHRTLK